VPIVMGYSVDPVGLGFVESLARPGGNITGLASSLDDTTAKLVELLITVVPGLSRIGLLTDPGNPNQGSVLKTTQASVEKVGLTVVLAEARTQDELEGAFSKLASSSVGAAIGVPDAFFASNRERIAEMALRQRMATIFSRREYVAAGGLLSYGEKLFDFLRRVAGFVDEIFKGGKPGDLPIEQPTRFFLVVNMKTAKALDIIIPPRCLPAPMS
jgi:ABC-type uncharacterized transport system substrate-binding protein